jgi:hypothetical protein
VVFSDGCLSCRTGARLSRARRLNNAGTKTSIGSLNVPQTRRAVSRHATDSPLLCLLATAGPATVEKARGCCGRVKHEDSVPRAAASLVNANSGLPGPYVPPAARPP